MDREEREKMERDVLKFTEQDTQIMSFQQAQAIAKMLHEVYKATRKADAGSRRDCHRKKIYISGPITGTADYMERFARAEAELEAEGYAVINPAKVNAMLPEETSYEQYMNMSMTMLEDADMIYMLEGWETSGGARREFDRARAEGKPIRKQRG